jgi:hypothetical protein
MWNFKILRMTMGEFFPGSQEGRPHGLTIFHTARRRTGTELISSIDESMSEYGIVCIAMDTTPASPADDHSIADEPHVATCSDLDAWASMVFVFLLELAMCSSRGEATVAYIQWHDRFGSESPLKMSVVRASASPAFNQEEQHECISS